MSYFFQSIKTVSYWRYALFTFDSIKSFFAVLGAAWGTIEVLDYFSIVQRTDFPKYSVIVLIIISVLIVVITRRPINRIKYKLSGKDVTIEVRIGNLFNIKGQKIIGTNTTFDTDMANGIISPNSLQGQFTNRYYPQNLSKLDDDISTALASVPNESYTKHKGKTQKYPIGTTIKLNQGPERFLWLAMAEMNEQNTAQTTLDKIIIALNQLWTFIGNSGEMEDVVLPLIGTGRGRITTTRKRLIISIAQSFIEASDNKLFSNKLIIVIHPNDVENFGINLFEVRDLLGHYLD